MKRPQKKKKMQPKALTNVADLISRLTVVKIDITCSIVRLISLINLFTHNNLQKDQAVQ